MTPPRTPYPISSTTSLRAAMSVASPACACATARTMKKTGTQIPSFSPLSTLRPWRTRDGSRGSVTTACPSAASVGARTTARSNASGHDNASRSTSPTPKPTRMVSGRPIPSSRAGIETSSLSACRSIREASPKRTRASVASASSLTGSPETDGSTNPRASTPTSSPTAVNTIGAVIERSVESPGDRRVGEQRDRDGGQGPGHTVTLLDVQRLLLDHPR